MIDLFVFMVIVIQQGMSQTTIPYWVGTVSKEKKDLIIQFGLHQAIHYWNQKMSRATKDACLRLCSTTTARIMGKPVSTQSQE